MKTIKLLVLIFNIGWTVSAQNIEIIPNLSKVKDSSQWVLKNRNLTVINNETIYLDLKPGGGMLWMKDFVFSNGMIECDIKGENVRGKSFVGIAFNGEDKTNYDAIYFRPFNFENPQKKNHSVQYISQPKYTWSYLRKNYPEKYENALNTKVNPDEWFHIKIVVNSPGVEVYINNSNIPSLKVEQINSKTKGWIGFWVGNNSKGWFKNLKITKAQ